MVLCDGENIADFSTWLEGMDITQKDIITCKLLSDPRSRYIQNTVTIL